MTLKDYLDANKKNSNLFVAIYNKNDKWIICGLVDDSRLVDYYDVTVISESAVSSSIVKLVTDYDKDMQVGYYRMKAEQAESAVRFSDHGNSASESKQRKSGQRRKAK